ncbi:MAG: hypothetical protein KC468_00970, partial [Myxococcales bacterium]|nr:hypothetical protein [Myxococcales bacterium]
MSRSPESSPTSRSARIGLGVVGCVHAGLAAAWMQAMAGGFGLVHRMSLANRWAPGLLLVMGLGASVAAVNGSARWTRVGVLGVLGTWVGIGVAAMWVFPTNADLRWLLLALAGGAAAWIVPAESIVRRLLALAPGVGAGAVMVWAQRSPEPSTRPAGGELTEVAPSPCDWDGTVKFALGHGVQLAANGLLVFESVSPDRSWTALAPGDRWRGLEPRCIARQLGEREVRARFEAEGEASLVVRVDEATA